MRRSLAICTCILWLFVSATYADHHEEGFISIFDGKSLTNWDGNPKFWSIRDGAITGTTTKDNPTNGNTFVIWRGGEVDDFELRLRFKIVGGNSGIQYRSEDKGNWVVGGYQGDFESGDKFSGILYEEKGRGILAQRGQITYVRPGDKPNIEVVATVGESSEINKVIKKEDWNDYKIIADGNRIMHIINGRLTCQVTDLDKDKGKESGVLALQLHAGPPMVVQFKDIRIKPLGAISVAGKWDFVVETEFGNGEPKFQFTTKDGKLSGSYSGIFGEIDGIKGKVKGEKVSWTISAERDGQEITADYFGKITEFGKMSGTVMINGEIEGKWTATRSH